MTDPTTAADALRPLPVDNDLDTGGLFEAARRGELALRVCNGCNRVLHMPRAHCRNCGSWDGRWQVVAGRGTLASWTVVAHQVHPAFPVPYTLVLVDIDEAPGARMIGHIAGALELRLGQTMEVTFETLGEVDGRAVVVPQWLPAGGA